MDPEERSRTPKSDLPTDLLIKIISLLPFKQAVRTSILSKRWRNLHRDITDVIFKESEFLNNYSASSSSSSYENGTTLERFTFVHGMHKWMSTFNGSFINRFELYFPKPKGFEESISSLIKFAVSKKVKNLVLDFSDHAKDFSDPSEVIEYVVFLPPCVYETLESLKLIECKVEMSELKESNVLKSLTIGHLKLNGLTIGHLKLNGLTILLSKFPALESLRFIKCISIDEEEMEIKQRRLRELVFENCYFTKAFWELKLPELVIFKYSGEVPYGHFDFGVNKKMQEAYLDFGLETRHGHEHADGTGFILASLLNGISSAKTLTICSFLLQMIPYDDEVKLSSFGTRHLVMKTNLHPHEFRGISLIIKTCPILESLTLQIVPPRPMKKVLVPKEFNAETYWLNEISQTCLEKTLKVVEVKGFSEGEYELQVVKYLIKYGLVLERLDLYISGEEDQAARSRVEMALQSVSRGSSRLQITTLHDP